MDEKVSLMNQETAYILAAVNKEVPMECTVTETAQQSTQDIDLGQVHEVMNVSHKTQSLQVLQDQKLQHWEMEFVGHWLNCGPKRVIILGVKQVEDYLWNDYPLDYKLNIGECNTGEWDNWIKGDEEFYYIESSRDWLPKEKEKKMRKNTTGNKDLCNYKQKQENLQRGLGSDLRASDIRTPD